MLIYSQTSIDMIALETAASPNPVANKDAWLDALLDDLPYNVDDYYITPPKELIDDVLDDNFTVWIELDRTDEQDRQGQRHHRSRIGSVRCRNSRLIICNEQVLKLRMPLIPDGSE